MSCGYFAYRYQNRCYRRYLNNGANPSSRECWDLIGEIPRDPAETEAWILEQIGYIEQEKEYRSKHRIADEVMGYYFNNICADYDWILPDLLTPWTFLADLDNRVLTVNGAVHFRLNNMPPMRGFVGYFEHKIPLSPEYFTDSSLWPIPHFDTQEAQRKYGALQPTIVPFAGWGAPTWSTLSVSQHVSAFLMRNLVQDTSGEFLYTHILSVQRQLRLFCWQLTCAAATSNLVCPPVDSPPINGMLYASANDAEATRSNVPTILYHVGCKGFHGFYWFRGCLIVFCRRLNEPVFMMHEVERMARALRKRKSTHTSSTGIIVSSWQMVAVTIDDLEIRHSAVLDLHDGKGVLKEGALLLIHLLSPILTVTNAPRRDASPIPSKYNSSAALPEDILRHIIHFTDLETYLRLPLVSRLVRSICLAHPRVGNYTLLSKEHG